MSLYADYLAETGHLSILETESGFATYRISGQECYIQDIYVVPEMRRTKEGSQLADYIGNLAKQYGCKYLTGSVNTQIKDPTASMKALLGYGFKFLRSEPLVVWFIKEL